MDLEKVGEELGTEVEGVRNRLSFLAHNPTPGYVALEEQEKAGTLQRDESLHEALSTPFDALFLTLYFIQIYVLQLVLQIIIIIWTFTDPHDIEHDVLLTLDSFAVFLLCVEVSSGLLAKGKEFLEDWGGRIDLIVAIFSVLALSTYFFGLWQHSVDLESDETNLELAHSCKLLRDLMRVIRLPIFLRNVLAVWRYFEANRLAHKRRSL